GRHGRRPAALPRPRYERPRPGGEPRRVRGAHRRVRHVGRHRRRGRRRRGRRPAPAGHGRGGAGGGGGAGVAARVVVGAGPGRTSLLERLVANAPELAGATSIDVHVIDPHPPGAGRVWRHAQSPLLWMNSMVEDVTMFTDASVVCDGPIVPGPDLAEW